MIALIQGNETAFASLITVLICVLVSLLFKQEVSGKEAKYYLIAFYISAIIYFLTSVNPHTGQSLIGTVSIPISMINGALLPFLMSAFICHRYKERHMRKLLFAIVIINSTRSFAFS